MLVLKRLAALAAAVTPGLLIGGAALAGSGQPSPWQMGFQQAATPVMENIVWFHDFLLWLIAAITLFVLALLVDRDRALQRRANPTPSRTTHNTLLEVMWTLVPVIILVAIAVPSFKLLFLELDRSAGRPDREGDRQAVVLELQLSRHASSSSTR